MLPVGVSEEVELVAIGDFNGSLIPVIVQNNTEEIVYEIEVKVDVRDASGSLVAVGQSQSTHAIKPHVVLPDEYAFGWIFLDVPSIEGMDLKYNVNYEDEPGIFASSLVSLDFGELNWVDDRIVGEVINPSDEDLRGVWMNVVCVDSSGLPVAVEIHHIPDISAKEIITFQVTGGIFGDLTKCEHFAITGEARP